MVQWNDPPFGSECTIPLFFSTAKDTRHSCGLALCEVTDTIILLQKFCNFGLTCSGLTHDKTFWETFRFEPAAVIELEGCMIHNVRTVHDHFLCEDPDNIFCHLCAFPHLLHRRPLEDAKTLHDLPSHLEGVDSIVRLFCSVDDENDTLVLELVGISAVEHAVTLTVIQFHMTHNVGVEFSGLKSCQNVL